MQIFDKVWRWVEPLLSVGRSEASSTLGWELGGLYDSLDFFNGFYERDEDLELLGRVIMMSYLSAYSVGSTVQSSWRRLAFLFII